MIDEQDREKARDRMTGVALGLAAKFGPIEAANLLIAAGSTLLEREGGPLFAIQYLEEMAAELRRNEPDRN